LISVRPAVDHPGEHIPKADADEQGEKRVLGSLLTDSLGALAVVPVGLRGALACCARIVLAPVVGFSGCFRSTSGDPREGCLRLTKKVLGCALSVRT
jgi:hypothetical protein